MSIEDQLKADMKTFMVNKDANGREFNGNVRAKILEKKKSPGFDGEMTDAIAIDVITAYQKTLQKAVDQFEGDNAEYLDKLNAEIAYCQNFLPSKLTEDEIKAAIAEIKAGGTEDTNMVMKALMQQFKGRVDGKQVRELITAG